MDTLRVFCLFIHKQWMALRYHWKSFIMLLAGCLALQFMVLHFAYQPIETLRVETSAENTEELVKIIFIAYIFGPIVSKRSATISYIR